MNNFERLLEEYEKEMDDQNRNSIHSSVWGTLGVFQFIGVMIDMYVPKMIRFLMELSGGESNGDDSDSTGVGEMTENEKNE